jgi:hypothetical protein
MAAAYLLDRGLRLVRLSMKGRVVSLNSTCSNCVSRLWRASRR